MARLRYFDAADMPPEIAAALAGRPPMNLFRALPHAPSAMPGFLALGKGLREQGQLDLRLRELVILRVGALSRAAYEMHHHRRVGRDVGLSAADISAALREGTDDHLSPLERLVLRFTDAVVLEVKAPPPLYMALAEHFTERQMAELILTIGFYTMVCRFLENFEIDIETTGEAP